MPRDIEDFIWNLRHAVQGRCLHGADLFMGIFAALATFGQPRSDQASLELLHIETECDFGLYRHEAETSMGKQKEQDEQGINQRLKLYSGAPSAALLCRSRIFQNGTVSLALQASVSWAVLPPPLIWT